jgi:hypothetical protein
VDSALGAGRENAKTDGAGGAVLFPVVEPWATAVYGPDILKELEEMVRRFVVLSTEAAVAVALWILHTHAIDAAQITPRLAILSPTKRCGKSTMLKLLGTLVRKPLAAANLTAAGLFRGIEAYEPTLLVDEADTFLEGREDLRGVLNAGHDRQSATVMRCAGEDFEPRLFRVFAPVAIAAIGRLPDTLMDRSIVIEMRRKTGSETVDRFTRGEREGLARVPRRCARWVADNLDSLRAARPKPLADIDDRAADNWEALFAIADLAGEDWPARARAAAKALSGARAEADDSEDLAVQLLADVRAVFADCFDDRLTSRALTAALAELEGRPWAEICRGRPITDRLVARLLGRFRVKPKSIRIGDATPKGYLRDGLGGRLRPLPRRAGRHVRHNVGIAGERRESVSATRLGCCGGRNRRKALGLRRCCGCCARRPRGVVVNGRSPYLTTAEAAAYLRYRSASAIRNLVAAGRLHPAGRRGRTWLFLVSELDASVASHGASVAPAGDDHAETDPIPGNRSPSRWPQAHPAASHGPQNRPDEGGGPSRRGDGGERTEAEGGVARRSSARRSRGGGRAEAHRLRDIVATFAAAGAKGVDGGDVR